MKAQIEELWNIITTDCDNKCVGCEFENDDWCFTHRVVKEIYNAGYRKQKEGEWIGSGQTDEYICSLCGGIAPVDCEKEDFYKSNFCPNCGASMKGD